MARFTKLHNLKVLFAIAWQEATYLVAHLLTT